MFMVYKFVLLHTMQLYRGRKGVPPHILNLGATWDRVVNITLRPLYSSPPSPLPPTTGEITTVPIQLEVWWAPASVWKFCRREKSIFPGETRTPDRRARSLVTIYDLYMLEI